MWKRLCAAVRLIVERLRSRLRPANRDRALPDGHQWIGHCGTRARLRYLRQRWEQVKKLRDPESVAARERLWRVASTGDAPVSMVLLLSHAALQASERSGYSWAQIMGPMLDKVERDALARIEGLAREAVRA